MLNRTQDSPEGSRLTVHLSVGQHGSVSPRAALGEAHSKGRERHGGSRTWHWQSLGERIALQVESFLRPRAIVDIGLPLREKPHVKTLHV